MNNLSPITPHPQNLIHTAPISPQRARLQTSGRREVGRKSGHLLGLDPRITVRQPTHQPLRVRVPRGSLRGRPKRHQSQPPAQYGGRPGKPGGGKPPACLRAIKPKTPDAWDAARLVCSGLPGLRQSVSHAACPDDPFQPEAEANGGLRLGKSQWMPGSGPGKKVCGGRAGRSVGDGQESVVLGNGISPTQTSPPDLIRGSTHPASLLAIFTSPPRGLEVVWRCQMEGAGGAFQTHRGLERYARMAGGRCSGGAARLYSADRQKSIG